MNPPATVREKVERTPADRQQNVPLIVTPYAVRSFDYYAWTFVSATLARFLSLWGFPWWTADAMTGYGSGAYGAGTFGMAPGVGDFGALRYGMGNFGTGGYT